MPEFIEVRKLPISQHDFHVRHTRARKRFAKNFDNPSCRKSDSPSRHGSKAFNDSPEIATRIRLAEPICRAEDPPFAANRSPPPGRPQRRPAGPGKEHVFGTINRKDVRARLSDGDQPVGIPCARIGSCTLRVLICLGGEKPRAGVVVSAHRPVRPAGRGQGDESRKTESAKCCAPLRGICS